MKRTDMKTSTKEHPWGTPIKKRHNWGKLPHIAAAVVFALGFGLVAKVLKDSKAASAYTYSINVCPKTENSCIDNSAEAGIYRTYRALLHRAPDASGLKGWKSQMIDHNIGLNKLASDFISFEEWQNQYAGISNSQFISNTYSFVLNRAPDQAGFDYWRNQLDSGQSTKGSFAANIIDSAEAKSKQRSVVLAAYFPEAPTPAPTPAAPPATPAPTSQTTSGSTAARPRATSTAPSASAASPTGLVISDFAVTTQQYRSITMIWKTNRPTSTTVDFGTNIDSLASQQKDDNKSTEHSLTIQGDSLRAGKKYSFRLTAKEDGNDQTTKLEGSFETPLIAVTVQLKDIHDQAVTGASITVGEISQATDSDGKAVFSLPEGDNLARITKDGVSFEHTLNVAVPVSDETQVLGVTFGEADVTSQEASGQSHLFRNTLIVITILLLVGLAAAARWILARRAQPKADDFGISDLRSLPQLQNQVEHHTSLPELVAQSMHPDQLPVTPGLPEPNPVLTLANQIEHHQSLAEMVAESMHKNQPAQPDPEPVAEIFTSSPKPEPPISAPAPALPKSKPERKAPATTHKTAKSKPATQDADPTTLTIHHDQ